MLYIVSMENYMNEVDKYIEEITETIEYDVQKLIRSGLEQLFMRSPHHSTAPFADSEYDANHHILINNLTDHIHNKPTLSKALSEKENEKERKKTKKIKLGDKIKIVNSTEHAEDVEYGTGWTVGGYYPYRETKIKLKNDNIFTNVKIL